MKPKKGRAHFELFSSVDTFDLAPQHSKDPSLQNGNGNIRKHSHLSVLTSKIGAKLGNKASLNDQEVSKSSSFISLLTPATGDVEPETQQRISSDINYFHRPDEPSQQQLRPIIKSNPSTTSLVSLANATNQLESAANARKALVSLLSGLYALLLIILAFAFEMSLVHVAKSLKPDHYKIFYIYLYSVSIGFLLFCSVLLIESNSLLEKISKPFAWVLTKSKSISSSISTKVMEGGPMTVGIIKNGKPSVDSDAVGASHSGKATGSLYLRLGAVVFGTVGIVQNCLHIFTFFDTKCLSILTIISLVLFTVFIYGQIYFIFINYKIVIHHRFQLIGKFGLMHLITTNLCIWIRSLVEEEHHLSTAITHAAEVFRRHNFSSNLSYPEPHETPDSIHLPDFAQLIMCSEDVTNGMLEIIEVGKPFMTTCLIEYSLICAAVMLVIWMNVGERRQSGNSGQFHQRRNHSIQIDCSSSNQGLFAGLLFLVFTLVSMVVFFVEVSSEGGGGGRSSLLVFYYSDITLYLVTICACIMTFYRFRLLTFVSMKGRSFKFVRRSTLLDDILLIVALVGQVMFCIFSIVAVTKISTQAILHIAVALLRLTQVLLQTVVIMTGQRLAAVSDSSRKRKPGRQLITFLLLVNVALWLINTFEAQKASANSSLAEIYGHAPKTWMFIVHCTVPLTIFYRFHSTVCLAEIWKNAYKIKHIG